MRIITCKFHNKVWEQKELGETTHGVFRNQTDEPRTLISAVKYNFLCGFILERSEKIYFRKFPSECVHIIIFIVSR